MLVEELKTKLVSEWKFKVCPIFHFSCNTYILLGKDRKSHIEHGIDSGSTIIVTSVFKSYSTSDANRSTYKIIRLCQDYAAANTGIKLILLSPKHAFKTPNINTSDQKQWLAAILGTQNLFEKHVSSKNPPFTASLFGIYLKEGN